jgi:energy-coupling factor transporter ATP-binding protein EcfA2
MAELGDIAQIHVEGLLGRPEVTLRPATQGPTLLTGANGTGKSTILKAIEAIGTGRWPVLVDLPISAIRLDFTSREYIRVARRGRKLLVTRSRNRWWFDLDRFEFLQRNYRRAFRESQGPLPDSILQMDPDDWPAYLRRELAPPDWVHEFVDRFKVQFITDQRLVVQETRRRKAGSEVVPIRHVVEQYARDLAQQLSEAQAQYAVRAQTLDREFPRKVVNAMVRGHAPTEQDVNDLLERLAERQSALQHVNLLGREQAPPAFDSSRLGEPSIRSVIGVFAQDSLSKFDTLEPMRVRLKLFLDFLNQHYRSKAFRVGAREGFSIELENGSEIEVNQLSSGEQQMLVLAYQILFQTEPGTLLLIDEPELSLHVLWQTTLVDDLTEMGRQQGLSFILATHSPTLIGDRDDLTRSLD